MVIQLPAVRVDYPRNTARTLDQVWWALASSELEVREYVHGMWIVDAHTRTDTALEAPVPGVLMAASGQSLDATRTGVLEQLAWFWLLSPNLSAPGEED
jgi:hypothetical protein